ncbi:PTS sugar transporter subunit IIA [Spiroplasma platyhelix]|uniref:PTS sugar transporter subunit IIA n=1 Tax=Spiroplasma platyhelix PALS-1 TaxID=1276218 RepID=A0A846UCF3_9MOLU|nr:PTS sugar transporter subunit IIA [Spiroplasma platyhelix]MBE4703825.1 PTS system fructose-specific EIIABC component [Spiroplasma platyhelix PALS-1]NKE38198.1 PTS sugar transporter subunit IIA [Spiroplasma platyhelix PALS-1]UJB29083.1 PTS system fructose-specific IIA component [Spiroplasma platyhelix PALS-1]
MEKNQILKPEQIFLDIDESSQKETFIKIASVAKELNFINKEKKLIKAFYKREKESSTGFGDGFAIPHARNNDIKKPGIFFLRLKDGVEWDALDGNPVKIVIALIVPLDKASDTHLELLSKVAQRIIKPEVQKVLSTSKDKEKILKELMG